MGCACIRKYDFDLDYTSCKDLTYVDRSEYQSPGGAYTLQVINEAGSIKEYSILAGVSTRLNLTGCENEIYTFKVSKNCDKEFTKKVAVLCGLKCGWLKATAKLGAGHPLVLDLDLRIRLIDYAVRDNNIQVARDLIKTVKRDLKRVNCECSC